MTIDFETRSACDLKTHGSWRYALDPTTEPLCLAFRLPSWPEGKTALWYPAFPYLRVEEAACPELAELFRWIINGGLVEAHNAFFERGIWKNIMTPRFGWPEIQPNQWRCSAAKAAAAALPRQLADACKALGLTITKDEVGGKVMKKVSKPRKPRKAELENWEKTGRPILWYESRAWFEQLWAYCRQDVLAEEALSARLPDLSDDETAMYVLDQVINERGVRIDQAAVAAALRLIAKETGILNSELATLTDGAVTKVTQRARLMAWLDGEGLKLDNTQKQTIDDLLQTEEGDLPPWVGTFTPKTRRALGVLRELGRSSTAKYEAMRKWSCADERVHGSMLYHGATTGRWAGAGVQPHNFPKGALPKAQLKTWDMFYAWLLLLTEDRDAILGEWGSVMAPLSQGLRGAIIPAEGKRFYVADYAAIEARVLLWLAEDEEHLDIFRRGEDIYCEMASHVYGYPCSKKDTPKERDLGKLMILGLGYGMGVGKFVATAATFGITLEDDFGEDVVAKYREKFHLVKQLWWDQEEAAINAVHRPNTAVVQGRITWRKEGLFLYATLPSGRRLSYPFPQVKAVRTPWGAIKDQLSYMGVNAYTRQWTRQTTYGGMIVENCLAEGTEALTRRGWVPIEQIRLTDEIWDGLNYVTHSGLLYKGVQEVVSCDGMLMTRTHQVLTSKGWQDASSCEGSFRTDVWLPNSVTLCREQWQKIPVDRTLYMRDRKVNGSQRVSQGQSQIVWLQKDGVDRGEKSNPRDESSSSVLGVAIDDRSVRSPYASGVEELRRTGNPSVHTLAETVRPFLGGYGADVSVPANSRTTGQQQGLLANELLLGDTSRAEPKPSGYDPGKRDVPRSLCRQPRHIEVHGILATQARVFDLLNCGPKKRFVVRNAEGTRALIVHNCVQAISRDILAAAMVRLEATGVYRPVLTVHDEIVCEAHPAIGDVDTFVQLVATIPDWAEGCPIEAEGFSDIRYHK